MKNVEDTTADYMFRSQAAMSNSSDLDNKDRRYYNAKLLGFHETYHIICISIDVIFEENVDKMFGDLDFNNGDKQ